MSEITYTRVETVFRATFGPVTGRERIDSIDVLRGFALLGILLMNILDFGLPQAAYFNPQVDHATSGANLWAYLVNWFFFEGAMRTIFSMLFGAGVILFTSRGEERDPSIAVADVYYRRTLLLIAFGVIDGYLLLWYGDILYAYGVCGLLLFVFRRAHPRTLLVLSLACFAVVQTKTWLDGSHIREITPVAVEAKALEEAGGSLSAEQRKALDDYNTFVGPFVSNPKAEAEEIAMRRGGYATNVLGLAPVNSFWQSTFFYTVVMWDVLAMMFLGMAFYKWHVFDASRSWTFYGVMLLVGYGVGLTTNGYELHNALATNFDLRWLLPGLMPTYNLGRGGSAIGHIALVMLICKSGLFGWITRALAAVGRMALTNYLSHSVICMFIFTGVGFGLFGKLERYQLYYVVFAIWVFQLIASPLWLRFFRFGPVEWVWRSLTYGRAQPMRVGKVGAVAA